MRYIGLGLFREGSTDTRFLAPVLRRLTLDICLEHATESVEVSDVIDLGSPTPDRGLSLEYRILEAAKASIEAIDILFIHTDGAGNPGKARAERVDPAVQLIQADPIFAKVRPVAVIPVREMEAWAIADGDALRSALNASISDQDLGVPTRPRDVESILDPKAALRKAVRLNLHPRRAKKISEKSFLDMIGEKVDLNKLRLVPSFTVMESELQDALTQLGVLR